MNDGKRFRASLNTYLGAPRTWTIAGCVAIAFVLTAPMIVYCPGGGACRFSLGRLGTTDDWRHFSMLWEAARVALSDFHQFPILEPVPLRRARALSSIPSRRSRGRCSC